MQNALLLIITALAVYRLSYLISTEDGPADVCYHVREWVHQRYPDQDVIIRGGTSPIIGKKVAWQYRGVQCPKCISFWLGFVGALLVWPGWFWYVPLALALSAVTVVIEKWSSNAE